jgi:NTE family protein
MSAAADEAWWQELPSRVPVVSDRSLLHLVNSIGVAADLTAHRPAGFFDKALAMLPGQKKAAQSRVALAHLAVADGELAAAVESLASSATVSNLALVQTQRHLLRLKETVELHEDQLPEMHASLDSMITVTGSRLAELEGRVAALESGQALDRLVNAWRAGNTYQRLPWLLAVTLLCCDAADRFISPLEDASGTQPELRQDLINRLSIALKAEGRTWFSFATLLTQTAAAVGSEDQDLLLSLADDMSPLERRRRKMRYMFTVWSAVVTAARGEPGLDAGMAAIARCREIVGPMQVTIDLRSLVTNLVTEAVDSATEVRGQLRRRQEQDIADMSGVPVPGRLTESAITPLPEVSRIVSGGPKLGGFAANPRNAGGGPRFGLVLAGGGARGAYEVGVLEYLADVGLEPDIIAGASIGALNGSVISAAGSIANGVPRLLLAWEEICAPPPDATPSEVTGDDAPENPDGKMEWTSSQLGPVDRLRALVASTRNPVLGTIEKVVHKWAPLSELRQGIELWVSVYAATQGAPLGLGLFVDLVSSAVGGSADWHCVQDFGDEALNLVLGSAALPPVFQPREVYTLPFRDGGLGNNIPVEPMAERGCEFVLVVHLSQQGLFDATQFGGLSILEIRPRQALAAEGALASFESMLDFRLETFQLRRRQGYNDARHRITAALQTHQAFRDHYSSLELLTGTTAQLGPL